MANRLYTFKTVGLYYNTSDTINTNVTRPFSVLILSSTGTDNIGPITFNGYLAGGNHTYTDSLGVVHKTAKTISTGAYIDNSLLNTNYEGYTDTLAIAVENVIFNPPDLPEEKTYITESVIYIVTPNKIDVTLSHKIEESIFIGSYYGMQSAYRSVQEKVFIPGSIYEEEIEMGYGISSGVITEYPDVHKILYRNSTSTICQELSLDTRVGLFYETAQYLIPPSSFNRIYTKINLLKTYFNQIRNYSANKGLSYFWKGSYSWFDRNIFTIEQPRNVKIRYNESIADLSWDNSVGAISYNVYRSASPYENFVYVANTTACYYSDIQIEGSDRYFYFITSIKW
jgi:hypothetical protein